MSGVTIIFDVAPALKSAFAANATLADIDRTSGPVAGDRDPKEWIQIGMARANRTPRTLRGSPLGGHDEDGTIPVLILTSSDGKGEDGVTACRTRIKTLIGAVEAALAADFTLGGTVRWAWISGIAEQDQGIEPPPDAGHWMTAELTISFSARVVPGAAS